MPKYWSSTLACLCSPSSSTTPTLPFRVLFRSPLPRPRPRYLDPPPALALLSIPPPLVPLAPLL